MTGTLSILNVGDGDTKLSFDKNNPAERIRAARIVTDMLRRGYALLVEVERNGEKGYERVQAFREDTCEYIIADFDPTVAAATETGNVDEFETQARPGAQAPSEAAPKKRRGRPSTRKVPAEGANAVAVGRSAGG